MTTQPGTASRGIVLGFSAYLIWGFLPVFFKLLQGVSPLETVAQRVIWSLVLLVGLLALRNRFGVFKNALGNPKAVRILIITAALIAINWFVYIWAIVHGHILEASLGYFLNPLVNVAMGVIFLKERLSRVQIISVALAAIGVTILAAGAGDGLWISLILAFSFATYGLLRKVAPVESLEGLSIETLILAPVALMYLIWSAGQGELHFGSSVNITLLLIAGGAITAVPLLLFAAAARLMPYAQLGLLQYVAPTIQFLLAIFVYGEHMTTAHFLCFAFIWMGLAIYASNSVIENRKAKTV